MRRLFLVMTFVAALLLAACGGSDEAPLVTGEWSREGMEHRMMDSSASAEMSMTDAESSGDGAGFVEQGSALEHVTVWSSPISEVVMEAPPERMLIQRATVEMLSEEFNDAVDNLRSIAASFGGYIESSNLSYGWTEGRFEVNGWTRIFNITLRVPVARFETAQRHVEGYGEVFGLHQSTEDVTDQLVDMQRRMEAKLVEEDRVQTFVERAENLEELFILEDRLTQIRTDIERLKAGIENTGDRVAFSTINVILWEALEEKEIEEEEITEYTFGERISKTFNTSVTIVWAILQGFAIFMAGAIVPLMILGVIAMGVITIIRLASKRTATNPLKYMPRPTEKEKAREEEDDE